MEISLDQEEWIGLEFWKRGKQKITKTLYQLSDTPINKVPEGWINERPSGYGNIKRTAQGLTSDGQMGRINFPTDFNTAKTFRGKVILSNTNQNYSRF